MKHFIGTRFNLINENWKTSKDGCQILNEEWLDHRFYLFEKYCFPSVINQKNRNFFWFIFFEKDTPEKFKKRFDSLTKDHPNFIPHYIDGMKSLNNSFKRAVDNYLTKEDKTVITTRIDNDDAIHKDFIETIQELAINNTNAVIDLRNGYQVNVEKNYLECRNYYTHFNPYISLIESTKNFNTVYSKMHYEWKDHDNIISYDRHPLWMEIVHQKNKLNDTKYDLPLTNNFKLNDFGIFEEYKRKSKFHILFNNNMLKVSRRMKRINLFNH